MGFNNQPACKSSILLFSGYKLKVRGSKPLPSTNLLILLHFMLNIFVNSIRFNNNLTLRSHVTLAELERRLVTCNFHMLQSRMSGFISKFTWFGSVVA